MRTKPLAIPEDPRIAKHLFETIRYLESITGLTAEAQPAPSDGRLWRMIGGRHRDSAVYRIWITPLGYQHSIWDTDEKQRYVVVQVELYLPPNDHRSWQVNEGAVPGALRGLADVLKKDFLR